MEFAAQAPTVQACVYHSHMGATIPIFRPALPPLDAVTPYLQEMDRSRVYSNWGSLVRQLERRYASFLGVPDDVVVAVSNGTAGITASVIALDVDRWIVPDWTFAATPLAVARAAKTVTFADVNRCSGVLDLSSPTKQSRGTGVLPVMPFGTFIPASQFIGQEPMVMDAAASLPNARGRLAGLAEHSTVVFSLHATKILGCGEGGLVVCGSSDLADAVRSIINFGFDDKRTSVRSGFNGKMPEISAAWALAALDRAEAEVAAWRVQAARAQEASLGIPLDLFSPAPGEVAPYWVMRWPVSSGQMPQALIRSLQSAGIEARRWWPSACTSMPAFDHSPTPTPNAHWFAQNSIGLPMSIDMTVYEFTRVADVLRVELGASQ